MQDTDTYKSSVRDSILSWLDTLKKCGITQDWMIVLVEASDVRKSSKLLPRTSVLDKIKADLSASKQMDRCVSLIGKVSIHYFKKTQRWGSS